MKCFFFLLLSGFACWGWGCTSNGQASESMAAEQPSPVQNQGAEPLTLPPADAELPAGYYAFDSASFNLDGDAWPDKLRALEPQSNKKANSTYHPVVVYQLLRGTGKNSFTRWAENKILLSSLENDCPADGYQRIVAKPPYFTIEQVVCTDFKFASQYVTFKYNKTTDQVILHKWGEEYTDRSNPDNPLADFIHTPADFGNVSFAEASRELIVAP